MNKSLIDFSTPFYTIYIEENAYNYPLTKKLIKRYSNSTIIPIRHYKDVFNRTNQHFSVQKDYTSLILAIKGKNFLYEGSNMCQNFGYPNFYYTSLLFNCLFDCEYCYLQGIYPSANLVAFVNIEDFKLEIANKLAAKPFFLALSYDTDLIALNPIIPYLDHLYDFFTTNPELTVEIRTKSASKSFYKNFKGIENIIIAFTLSPQEVIQKYERNTPSLKSRLEALQTAIDNGFKVRVCFDPVFIEPEFEGIYKPFYKQVFSTIDPKKILDIGYGFFRMPKVYFKRIKKHRNSSRLFQEYFYVNNGIVSYSPEQIKKTKTKHIEIISKYIAEKKIYFHN